MSFIIKGFDTDGNCLHCFFQSEDSDRCLLTDDDIPFCGKGHPESCPIVQLPEGHGRLGDLDALRKEFPEPEDWKDFAQAVQHITGIWATIDNAPTIVPAEGGTDECSES